jgi:hypothetical protein
MGVYLKYSTLRIAYSREVFQVCRAGFLILTALASITALLIEGFLLSCCILLATSDTLSRRSTRTLRCAGI